MEKNSKRNKKTKPTKGRSTLSWYQQRTRTGITSGWTWVIGEAITAS